MGLDLRRPVSSLKGVGLTWQKRLEKLGIRTVRDLLWHFPHRYEDFSNVKKTGEVRPGETCSVIGTVSKIKIRRTFRRKMFLVEAVVKDDTGALRAVWFNQYYMIRNIPQGALVALAGKVLFDDSGYYFSSPAYEVIERSPNSHKSRRAIELYGLKHTAGLIPVYPETRGFTSRAIRYLVKPLIPATQSLPDPLPADLRNRVGLLPFAKAIKEIHFPTSRGFAQDAKKRFAFEDIFLVQLLLHQLKARAKKYAAPMIPTDLALIKKFVASLPYELTHAQRKAAWEILQDLAKPTPMNRLLNGDVGSGKTIVATIAALQAVQDGQQVAILAPTEILSRQHFQKISKTLEVFPVRTVLLVAKETLFAQEGLSAEIKKSALIHHLKEGVPMIVIGTHALLQEDVRFEKLGLVVVDEQHRFGVEQRAHLTRDRALVPHLLSMTATPIPRTLAIGIYGDLDLSILDELPKGRQKIITKIIAPAERPEAHQFIRDQVELGRQVFVICPRIDPEKHADDPPAGGFWWESEDWRVEVKAVKTEFEKLSQKVFPDLKVAMLHGRMPSLEKDEIMKKFAAGKTDVLVSTSVVEVGVDVPNATVMMIDGTEHFGLSQLHQFRGRVGRGTYQSYCLLFTESPAKTTRERLEALIDCDDGFKLAEKDLEIRGPGQFFGREQSGLPDLAMRSITDLPLVQLARQEAHAIFQKDPKLKNAPFLKARLEEFRKAVHLE